MFSAQCGAGAGSEAFGTDMVSVVTYGDTSVTFNLNNGMPFTTDYVLVYYDEVGGIAGTDEFCNEFVDTGAGLPFGSSLTAQCTGGSATVKILARHDSAAPFTSHNLAAGEEPADAQCHDLFAPVGGAHLIFNAASTCFFELTVPCQASCSSGRMLMLEETEETAELLVEEKSEESIACEEKSKSEGIHTIKVDECVAAPHEDPVKIISQDVDSVKFEVRQVWKGCEAGGTLSWVATDYINEDGDLTCVKESNMECGEKTVYTAHCTEGVAVVDLYTFDEERGVFGQADGSQMVTPLVCDAHGDPAKTCHFRYALQCAPAACDDGDDNASNVDESITSKLMGVFANLF